MAQTAFSKDILHIDATATAQRIQDVLKQQVVTQLKRRGLVVGLSGGIDSSVTAALAVRALGKGRVFGLFMPETDSSDEGLQFGRLLADALGVDAVLEDIGPILNAAGCYARRDAAIKKVFPDYTPDYKCKMVLSSGDGYAISSLIVQSPAGVQTKVRLTAEAYLGIVAAMNFKQRTRKMLEYYHADRLNYAVAGTPNRLEYDQGFFVKNGDGSADVKPIAHLYKSQVYQLAEFLGVPKEIQLRPSTTDTYSLPQSQEEFYFALPHDKMDFCLYGINHGVPAADVAAVTGLTPQQVGKAYRDIAAKRHATRYLHHAPLLIEDVDEID
jgi:NAD+ synthase